VLPSWNDGAAKRAIITFVKNVTKAGSKTFVAPEARIAVFDNDGTLWCEKPMPIELGFILRRLAAVAELDPSLRRRQPWKAACDRDYHWMGAAVTRHYHGDDSDGKLLVRAILRAFDGMTVETYDAAASAFLHKAQHPTLRCAFRDCGYRPMLELLRYLEANGFTTFIASGGNRDFMRSMTQELYGIPPEHVIGSSNALRFAEDGTNGALVYQAAPDVFDDGPVKPVRIWSRIGRRPILAVGNSNGDIQMLQFAGCPTGPGLRLLVKHDDHAREFDYTAGAERSLELADAHGWTIVSMKNDWATVFASKTPSWSAA
jgi:phosphoserine phosphatase